MRLKFDFSNGTESVDFQSSIDTQATPLELLVASGGSEIKRKEALQAYVRSIDYLCRGVSNYASGNIKNVSLEKNWFGVMAKTGDSVLWDAISDKSFVITYHLSIGSIEENMYVADAIHVDKRKGENGVNPVWIKELLTPKKSSELLRNQAIYAISIVTEFISGHKLAWGFNGKEGLSVVDRNFNVVAVEDIDDDETFILVKLLTLLISKGLHLGILIINCEGFSNNVVSAFSETARMFFSDTFVFLYNVPPNSPVERATVVLPNFLVSPSN